MAVPALALQAAPEVREKVHRLGELFAKQFGLTADADYVGWRLVIILSWLLYQRNLKGPLKAAWVIEQQLVGVLEQLYTWLGGGKSGETALSRGIVSLTGPGLVYEAVTDPWGTAAFMSGAGLIYDTGQALPADAQLALEATSPFYDTELVASWAAQVFHL